MILEVTEKCMLEDGKTGIRVYHYEANKSNFNDAKLDMLQNFDTDNIIYNDDNFEGECLDSEVIDIKELIE